MRPQPHTLYARAGDTFTRVLTWTEANGDPIDLTEASVEFSLASGGTEYQYEDTTQASITDASGGEITLTLDPGGTRALRGRAWQYEVTITFPNGTRTTILDGRLIVRLEVVA